MAEEIVSKLCKYTKCEKEANATCTRCREARYCSVECQRAHLEWHKKYCDANFEARKRNDIPDDRPVGRKVIVPNIDYIIFESELRKGHSVSLKGRDGSEDEIVLRCDGQIYEVKSGNLVIPFSKLREDISVGICNNWAKLMLQCGNTIAFEHGLAVFYDKKLGMCYVLNVARNKVIEEKYVGMGEIKAKIMQGETGTVVLFRCNVEEEKN